MSQIPPSDRISRKDASKRLKVTTRTVDRHIRKGKLSSHTENGRIWLSKKEVYSIGQQSSEVDRIDISEKPIDTVYSRRSLKEQKNIGNNCDSRQFGSVDIGSRFVSTLSTLATEKVYKNLYTELSSKEKNIQENLTDAKVRISKLETQLKNSISIIDYLEQTQELQKELKNCCKVLRTTEKNFHRAKISKTVYIIILFIVLILYPSIIIVLKGWSYFN